MKSSYVRAMERLYMGCIVLSAASLLLITLAVPYGVFMRYVVNSPASWPEPFAVLMMVLFTFVGGAAVYRAQVHIAVQAVLGAVGDAARRRMLFAVDLILFAMCVFMVAYGALLVRATWASSIAEFPGLSVGITYLPIPVGAFITLLFVIERLWAGEPPPDSVMYQDQPLPE